jgi:ligand-binding sensor domain-containing protein
MEPAMTKPRPIRTAVLLAFCSLAAPLLRAEPWKHVTEVDGITMLMIQFIERHGDDVWVGALDGLAVFRGGKPRKMVTGQATWDVLPVGHDRYWVGTQLGAVLLEGEKATPSLKEYSVGSLETFGDKALWAAAGKAEKITLMEYREAAWKPVPRFKGRNVSGLFRTRSGALWVMLEADGIVAAAPAKDPGEWEHHLKGLNVKSFCEDAGGRIWCGAWAKGILVFEGGTWKRHLDKEEAAITAIKQDGKGHLWAATNASGLWQYDGAQWTNHLRAEGTINFLEVPADGRVYVSSQSAPALRFWTGKAWETVLEAPGMFRTVINGPGGKLWAGNTISGLYVQP